MLGILKFQFMRLEVNTGCNGIYNEGDYAEDSVGVHFSILLLKGFFVVLLHLPYYIIKWNECQLSNCITKRELPAQ